MWEWLKGLFGSMFSGPSRTNDDAPQRAPERAPEQAGPRSSGPAPIEPSAPQGTPAPSAPSAPIQGAPRTSSVSYVVQPEKRGTNWYAHIGGQELLVGADVRYRSRRGLQLRAPAGGFIKYDPDAWRGAFGVWADMIGATAEVEGKRDLCTINTYDRACFTFGLMQWAAHEANDNLILLLRKLLALPSAGAYFPDLCLSANGRVARRSEAGVEELETHDSTEPLCLYLNPDSSVVGEAEVIAAGKLMHWVRNDADARNAMISFAIEHYRNLVKGVARNVPLNGRTDVEVLICADIRHQGRSGSEMYGLMRAALAKPRPVEALLEIGGADYAERVNGLLAEITKGQADARLGVHRYNAETGEMERMARVLWAEAHISPRRGQVNRQDTLRVHKLSEPGAPTRDPNADTAAKVEALRQIALWIRPKASARYQPLENGQTCCNIYAYDFATLAGAYIPRVWWDNASLRDVEQGRTPTAAYGQNVVELSANALTDWFADYGARYGWRRAADVRELQAQANAGGIAIIVAKRKDTGRSGHITVVAPEGSTDEAGQVWNSSTNGDVFLPLQTQAGGQNFTFGYLPNAWWVSDKMQYHGFWIHD